jgi:toxin ParE1/3/4
MKVRVSARAKQDLLRIYLNIGQHNVKAADAVAERIEARLKQVSRFPFLGRPRPSLGAGIRSLVAGNHLIFYAVGGGEIEVARVLDGRMDIDGEFRR